MDTYEFTPTSGGIKPPTENLESITSIDGSGKREAIVRFGVRGFSLNFQGYKPYQLSYTHTRPTDASSKFLAQNMFVKSWKDKLFIEGYFIPRGVDEELDRDRNLLDETRVEFNNAQGYDLKNTLYLHLDGFIPRSFTFQKQNLLDFPYESLNGYLGGDQLPDSEITNNPFFRVDLDSFFERFQEFNGWINLPQDS